MAINQLNKYVWLVETIHRARKRGGITLKEIQSRWKDSDLSEGTKLSPYLHQQPPFHRGTV